MMCKPDRTNWSNQFNYWPIYPIKPFKYWTDSRTSEPMEPNNSNKRFKLPPHFVSMRTPLYKNFWQKTMLGHVLLWQSPYPPQPLSGRVLSPQDGMMSWPSMRIAFIGILCTLISLRIRCGIAKTPLGYTQFVI